MISGLVDNFKPFILNVGFFAFFFFLSEMMIHLLKYSQSREDN